ncbi:MAG: PIG-L family deacetylase [Gammaproteobacteria bacterium]
MLQPSFRGIDTFLAIGPHPDDIEIGCGGTLLRLLSEHEVDVLWFVLSGDQERRQEALASATRFLGGARSHRIAVENFRGRVLSGELQGNQGAVSRPASGDRSGRRVHLLSRRSPSGPPACGRTDLEYFPRSSDFRI